MKLHGHPLSTCTRKILMALAEKGASADLVTVDLLAGAHRSPAHRTLHPFAKIPVLEHDGEILYESRSILRYVDRVLEGPRLVPSGAREATIMDRWLSVDQSYVAPNVRALVGELLIKKHLGGAPDPQAVAAARAGLDEAFAVIDGALARSEHLAGGFSLADISLLPYVEALGMLEATDLVEARPALAAWRDRVRARPSWRAATAHA